MALEHLVLHRNGCNSKIISSFILVISYIPLFLGFLLNQGDQDLQVHPKHMGEKKRGPSYFNFHNLIRLEMHLKNVRRLPLFLVILLSQVLPINKIITIYIMLKFRWRWASSIFEFICVSTDEHTIKEEITEELMKSRRVHSKTI